MNTAGLIPLRDIFTPRILIEEKDFLIAYKPPGTHSAPLARSTTADSFLNWCALRFPEVADLPGRKAGEGGLLHRLDYETQGLMLIARTKAGMESLLEQQKEYKIIKEYSALTMESETQLPGFPARELEAPRESGIPRESKIPREYETPHEITSSFRPYGPGRKSVRPVIIGGGEAEKQSERYSTRILETLPHASGITSFRLMISRGFRHQIRSHLAWLRRPILNDALYGGAPFGGGLLALRACSLLFADPSSGKELIFAIPPLQPDLLDLFKNPVGS